MKRLVALAGVLAFSVPLRAADVHVLAAVSLTDALKEMAPAYEKATGDKLVFNLGGSNMLARLIREGAPADVFLSADEAQMDGLEKAGLLLPGSRRALLSNTLVVVVPSDGGATIASAQDLLRLRSLALAEPKSVPAGVYAKQVLEKLGLWEALAPRVIPTENVRACLAAVEAGNADAGFVYGTDALVSKKVRVAWTVPAADAPDISYPVAVLKDAPHAEAAKRFAAYLASVPARTVFVRYGFLVRDGSAR
jgi:molybdate transport system substrate-binding protein